MAKKRRGTCDSSNSSAWPSSSSRSWRSRSLTGNLRQQELDLSVQEHDDQEKTRDWLLYSEELETDADARREELLNARLDRDIRFAKWQEDNAVSEQQRLRATTAVEEAEHAKRRHNSEKFAKAEAKEQAKRQAVYEKVLGTVTNLSTKMVDAVWEQAQGQKGAILMMLGDYLKSVSKEMAVKALVETAKGVACLAGIYTAGLAPGHFAAAGLAAGAALAAGGAGIALGNAGQTKADEQKAAQEKEEKADKAELDGIKGDAAKDPVTKREGKNLSQQTVPISYDERRRADASPRSKGPETVILQLTITGPVVGAGGVKQVGRELQKMLDEAKSAGKLY